MRVKILRTLGPNLFDLHPDLKTSWGAAPPEPITSILEGQVRDVPDEFGQALLMYGLAEGSDDEPTALPKKPGPAKPQPTKPVPQPPVPTVPQPPTPPTKPAPAPKPAPAALAAGTQVEVTEKTHHDYRGKGEVVSAAPGTGGESMYVVKREDGTTFKALESQLKKV